MRKKRQNVPAADPENSVVTGIKISCDSGPGGHQLERGVCVAAGDRSAEASAFRGVAHVGDALTKIAKLESDLGPLVFEILSGKLVVLSVVSPDAVRRV